MHGWARYRVLRPLREGGAFDVLEAVALGAGDFERRVVLKRVRKEDEGVDEANEAILTEARLAGRLRHANVVATIDAGLDEEGRAYLAMDYVDGLDAGALWRKGAAAARPMPTAVAQHVVAEVANALDYVHAATDRDGRALGIVHRDVTPANVMISWAGDVLLTDFGIARGLLREQRTAAGLSKGTLDFMAPEQVTGGHIDPRVDIYGLGALLHCLITGRSPTHGLEMSARARGHRVVDPSVPPALQRVILAATAPDRADRYASASELALELWRAGGAATAGGGRAALRAWVDTLRTEAAPAARPGIAAMFALELPHPSAVLEAPPLHGGTAVHAPPIEFSSLSSFADGEDASTAESGRTDVERTQRAGGGTATGEGTFDATTVRGGERALELGEGVTAAAGVSLDRLAPVRLAEVPQGPERTRVARPVPADSAASIGAEDTLRRVGGTRVIRGPREHAAASGGDLEPATPPRRGGRGLYAAAFALVIAVGLSARAALTPRSPVPSVSVAVPADAPPGSARTAPPPSAPRAVVSSPAPSPAPSTAGPAITPHRERPSPVAAPQRSPRPARSIAAAAPSPSTADRAAPVSTSERLDALGKQLKALAQGGGPTDALQALESEYFRLRRASPQTPEEEQARARAVDALWARVQRAQH